MLQAYTGCPKQKLTSLKRHSLAMRQDKSTNYWLLKGQTET